MNITKLDWIELDSVEPDDGFTYLVHGTITSPGKVQNVYVVATKSRPLKYEYWQIAGGEMFDKLTHITWLHATRLD